MPRINFLHPAELKARFANKRVALVGSGPGVLDNEPGYIDGFDIVARVNNYRLSHEAGWRTDVFYSFFGRSIRKTVTELKSDGVRLCICKCPDAAPIESRWHIKRRKTLGIDFRWIYVERARFWFCDTYIPSCDEFLESFALLGKHVPTTGFAAIRLLAGCATSELYLTGFDFFRSGIHNVNERWRAGDPADPIGHVPELELAWLAKHAERFTLDPRLKREVRSALPELVNDL